MHNFDNTTSLARSIRQVLSATALSLTALAVHAQSALEAVHRFEIPAQSTRDALNEFSKQSGLRLLFSYEALEGRAAPTINGELTVQEVLDKLLSGTDLKYEITADSVVVVHAPHRFERTSLRAGDTHSSSMRLAQATNAEETGGELNAESSVALSADAPTADREPRIELEEVVVTGSHIRGAKNLSSPVITFDREDIDRGGFATTQQLIQKLPQNLNSVSDATQATLNGGVGYAANPGGAAVNLRGLGGDATLVLLNGRRLAAAGNGSYVDLSLIPLSAIERAEVLTDGASAIYGSDAVGGVVNLILREDFDGAEGRVRYGSVTEGSHSELQAAQTLGHSWASGHAFVSYDYFRRSTLGSWDRDHLFDSPQMITTDLLPEQKRHGALGVLNQHLSDRIELSSNLFYARRTSSMSYVYDFGVIMPQDQVFEVEQLGGTLGLKIDLSNEWQMRVSGVLDRTHSDSELLNGLTHARIQSTENDFRVWSFDVAADGPVMRAAGGNVRLAIGVHARNEDFLQDSGPVYQAQLDRDNRAAYAELLLPWFSSENRRRGIEHLELTLAGRYEHYSDFGQSFNPKIGVAWSPVRGLNVRSTWGTSFKAPLLNQMTHTDTLYLMDGSFRDEDGLTAVLDVTGNGINLGPEESRNWTAGLDFRPEALPGLSFSATYFDIDYDERISTPFPADYDLTGVLLDPVYRIVVERNPSLATVEQLIAGALSATCYSEITSSYCEATEYADRVTAIVDSRLRNLAGLQMSGVDFSIGYRLSTAAGEWGINVAGSKLLTNSRQLVPGVPRVSELNNVWAPVALRLRNTLSFSNEAMSILAAINYTDDYRDTRPYYVGIPEWRGEVSSWTTVDLTVQYELGSLWGGDLAVQPTLTLNALNLFDRDPPYVPNFNGFRYDGVNANALGRFVSAQFDVRW